MTGAACAAMLIDLALRRRRRRPRPLFEATTVLNMSLSGPIDRLSRKAGATPVPGVLKVEGPSPETLPVIAVHARHHPHDAGWSAPSRPSGWSSRTSPAKTSLFRGQKALKLVTHCQPRAKLRAGPAAGIRHLPAVSRPDAAKASASAWPGSTIPTQEASADRWGFFVEDIKDVAKRNGQERLRGVQHASPRPS